MLIELVKVRRGGCQAARQPGSETVGQPGHEDVPAVAVGAVLPAAADIEMLCPAVGEEGTGRMRHQQVPALVQDGAEVEKYWAWVEEVKPKLPKDFALKFEIHGGLIREEVAERENKSAGRRGKGRRRSAACAVS